MSVFKVYNYKGEAVGEVEQPGLFQVPVNQELIHRYVLWVRNAIRNTLSNTKTRGEISGGGKKPWKQKGTGRARVGSSRSPIWRKGGTVFGPLSARNWHTRMPRNERRQALMSLLSDKAISNQVVIVDSYPIESPKTKDMIAMIADLPIEQNAKVLHIHSEFEPVVFKSFANLPKLQSKTVSYTNALDILNNDYILMNKESLAELERHFNASL